MCLLAVLCALALGGVVPSAAHSGDDPVPTAGTVVDRDNVEEYEYLLGPSMLWAVNHGLTMPVIEHRVIEHPPPFLEATKRYSRQVKLSDDATHVLDQVAGLPFPDVDPADPQAAVKLMFNFDSAITVDDSDMRNFDCVTGQIGSEGRPVTIEKHFLADHIRRLYFVGRTTVEPIPSLPNRDRVRFKEALYPLVEPFDLKGVGFTMNRYISHRRHDDTWLYLPQLRRIRRLSSAQRSDALFGQDTDTDSYEGYQGNIAWMDWKLLGETTILATMHAENLPVHWHAPPGDFLHDDVWEPREVWILAGTSKLPQYAYSQRVIYLDREVYRIPYTELYDRAGELWKVWVNNYKFATHPRPDAEYGQAWDTAYRPSISMVDIQQDHATFCAFPSDKFVGEQGWYVNVGDSAGTTEEFFELSSLIAAGR